MDTPPDVIIGTTGTAAPGLEPPTGLALGLVQRRLLPLVEGGENEKVANLLARLIGDSPRAATSALVILTGLQEFLNTGKAEATALLWEPLVTARQMKQQWGGQAYNKACAVLAACSGSDDPNFRLYSDVCQILIQDPEQEKIAVDRQ